MVKWGSSDPGRPAERTCVRYSGEQKKGGSGTDEVEWTMARRLGGSGVQAGVQNNKLRSSPPKQKDQRCEASE